MAKIGINIKEGMLQKPENEWVVGIDLGTTNSLVAFVNPASGLAEVIADGKTAIVPSLLFFTSDGEIKVGEEAKNALITNPQSTVFSVKRLLGRSYADVAPHAEFLTYRIVDEQNEKLVRVEINGKHYSPVELSSYILSALKKTAEKQLGSLVRKAVITVPAYFNDNQRQATRDAGKLAGLDVLRVVNEPTAASLAYGIGLNPNESKTVVVYDLGGGTFDVSVLKIENGVFDVLATHGDTYLGGDDFDRAIALFWLHQEGLAYSQLSLSQSQALRLLAEKAKKQICSGQDNFTASFNIGSENFTCALDTNQFNSLIEPILKRTFKSVQLALRDAAIDNNAVDEVVLVGGSTRIPIIKTELRHLFPAAVIDDKINPDEVVALGAAIEADILAGNRKDLLLLDVTPLSLGIETLGGLMDTIITRNSRIPVRAARQYTTSIDGQTNLKVTVYQGERELVSENRKLAEFVLKGIPPMPAGLPKIEIAFMLDADGILKVSATELRSGMKQEITVIPQYGLTDAQVEAILLDSLNNAGKDVEIRMQVETETEAQQIIYTTEKFIEKNATYLTLAEASNTRALVSKLKESMKTGTRYEILSAIDSLNEYTKPFAERIMDIAIATALKGTNIKE